MIETKQRLAFFNNPFGNKEIVPFKVAFFSLANINCKYFF